MPGIGGMLSVSWAMTMKLCQVWAGKLPPVTRDIGVKSSLPSQTPTTYWPVMPMNQASR